MVRELTRLSSLGSPWASAVLGYLALMPGADGIRELDRAIELCKPHADRSDAYSLWVLAWALLHKGEVNLAASTMQRAAVQEFPPALLDFASFIWRGWGIKNPKIADALARVRRAEKVGHKGAWVWRSQYYRSGKFGIIRRFLGYLLMPLAWSRWAIGIWTDPLSCQVLSFQWSKRPLLQLEKQTFTR